MTKERYVQTMFANSKGNSLRRNIAWDIEASDIHIPDVCPILGIPLTFIRGKGRQKFNPSLDRIDSTLGYTKDNIQVISDLANKMKQDASRDELVAFAKGILKTYGA
jgi:hypothetical protein